MTTSNSLLERHKSVMPAWMPLYYEDPIEIVSGSGRMLTDLSGREYLDFFGGILVMSAGHNVPEISEAVRAQTEKLVHSPGIYLNENQVALAEDLAERSGIPDAKVFFTPSGSEANDTALMLAAAWRGSNHILALRHSYHGRTQATVPVTGLSNWSPVGHSPFQTTYLHGGYRFRSPLGVMDEAAYQAACLADLDEMLDVASAGPIAALIAEPILGVGGFSLPPDGLLGAYQKRLAAEDILYISDEVQTGWGRTGDHYWGYQAHGVQPDIITFAKGIGNGLAIGGVIARAEIMDCWQALSLSTFGGSPLTTAGARATLAYLDRINAQANAKARGDELLQGLEALQAEHPVIGDVRGKGLMIGIEFVEPGSLKPNAAALSAFMEGTRREGLLIGRGGRYANCARLGPALSVTAEEVATGLGAIRRSLSAMA